MNAAPQNEEFCYSCSIEVEGGRGNHDIGTCLLEWISALPTTVTKVTLYSVLYELEIKILQQSLCMKFNIVPH